MAGPGAAAFPTYAQKAPQVRRLTATATCSENAVERPTGAGEGIRTLDPNLGKVVLYP